MASWSELSEDIVALFADRLTYYEDFVRFGSVSKSWRSGAAESRRRRRKRPFEPWLVLENDEISGEEGGDIRSCYSLFSNKVFNLCLPELQGRRCWGTQYGWIITLGLDSEYHLFNPLTKTRFSLPHASTLPGHGYYNDDSEHMCRIFPGNFALSSNPSDSGESVVVMGMYGQYRELAFASPKDKFWKPVTGPVVANGSISDVIFFKDRFFYVSFRGTLMMCNTDTTEPVSADIAAPPPPPCHSCMFNAYLAEISGDLHTIIREHKTVDAKFYEDMRLETVRFYIYKFDFHGKQWIEVKNVQTHSLFVGNNTTFAISTSEYPEFKSNCIYFSDDYIEYYDNEFCDMGIYDMRVEAVIDPCYMPQDKFKLKLTSSPDSQAASSSSLPLQIPKHQAQAHFLTDQIKVSL